jgi:hypothetical protein
MADRPGFPTTGEDTATGSGSPPRMPRWVKVSAIIVAVVIAVFLAAQLTGIGGEHGPGRHVPGQQEQGHDPDQWNHR